MHVISYKLPDSLLLEVFTNEGTGTLVVNDIDALTPAEQSGQREHEPALGQGPAARRARAALTPRARTTRSTTRLVPYDVRGSIAHAGMLPRRG